MSRNDRERSHDRRREPPEGPRPASRLRTAGQLVSGGGPAGSVATLLYLAVGVGFWSLVGWIADRLLGTQWIVVLGACIGAASGAYVVYLHLRDALEQSSSAAGPSPGDPHPSGPDSSPRP